MMSKNAKILCCKCRGVASKEFYRYCKQYLDCNNPSVLPARIKRILMKISFKKMEHSDNIGYVDGIIITWKSSDINIQVSKVNHQYINSKVSMDHMED